MFGRIDYFYLQTAAEWTASLQVLHTYEAGIEVDTGKIKKGNGLDVYSALSYLPGFGGGGGGGDLLAANNLSDVANPATALANIGGISDISAFDTDDLAEGAANFYFTSGRAVTALTGQNVSIFTNDAGYITSAAQTLNDVLTLGNTTGGVDMVVSAGDTITVPTNGIRIQDLDASHALTVSYETDLTANRTLSIFTGDANRALTIAGTASIVGTNTGDQTSIVGITGTKAEFNTACTDGDFVFTDTAAVTVLGKSGATVSGTNTISEEVLASVLIPGGTLGNNDEVRVYALFEAAAAGAGNRIFRVRLHTSAAIGGTVYQQTTLGTGGGGYSAMARIVMKNSSTSQEGFGQLASVFGTGSPAVTSALNTANDMYVIFSSLKVTSGTDGASLRNYSVERIKG